MKWFKYFLCMLSATFLVACGGDDGDDSKVDYVNVVFRVQFPNFNFENQNQVDTKTYGNGKKLDMLKVEFISTDGLSNERMELTMDSEFVEVIAKLERGKVYNAIFWAQNSECEYYDLSNLQLIKMKNPAIASHEGIEKMDAFYGVCRGIDTNVADEYVVEMKRPLAQISVGTTGEWLDNKIELKKVPIGFSPMLGNVVETANLEINCAVVPDKVPNFKVGETEYNYMGLIYLFAPKNDIEILASMTTRKGKVEKTYELPNVKIRANYKTAVCGDYSE